MTDGLVNAGPALVSILRQGAYLIASIHTALDDSQMVRFQRGPGRPDRRSTGPAASSSTSPRWTCSTRSAPHPAQHRRDGPAARRRHRHRRHPARRRLRHGPARDGHRLACTPPSTSRRAWPTSTRPSAAAPAARAARTAAMTDLERPDARLPRGLPALPAPPRRGRAAHAATSSAGRRSRDGVSILDLAQVHHDVLLEVLRTCPPTRSSRSRPPGPSSSSRCSPPTTWRSAACSTDGEGGR